MMCKNFQMDSWRFPPELASSSNCDLECGRIGAVALRLNEEEKIEVCSQRQAGILKSLKNFSPSLRLKTGLAPFLHSKSGFDPFLPSTSAFDPWSKIRSDSNFDKNPRWTSENLRIRLICEQQAMHGSKKDGGKIFSQKLKKIQKEFEAKKKVGKVFFPPKWFWNYLKCVELPGICDDPKNLGNCLTVGNLGTSGNSGNLGTSGDSGNSNEKFLLGFPADSTSKIFRISEFRIEAKKNDFKLIPGIFNDVKLPDVALQLESKNFCRNSKISLILIFDDFF